LEARPGLPVFHLVVEFSLSHGAFSTAAQAVEETLSIRPQKTDHLLRREALAGLATVTAHPPCVPRVHRSTGSLREVEGLTFAPTVWWWCLRPAPPTRWPRAGAGRLGARLGTTPQIAGRPQRCGGASQLRKQGGATRHSWEGGGRGSRCPQPGQRPRNTCTGEHRGSEAPDTGRGRDELIAEAAGGRGVITPSPVTAATTGSAPAMANGLVWHNHMNSKCYGRFFSF